MILRTAVNKAFLAWLLLVILSGCIGKSAAPAAVKKETLPVPTSSRTPMILEGSIASPTVVPTPTSLQQLPMATASLQVGLVRPPSGWTVYSNPDYIQGLALHGRQLWAATLGGVAVWDLDTEKSVLYTTRDGLAEIQGNDIVYCPMPAERIFVAHSSGMLSVYDLSLQKWSRLPITFDDGSSIKSAETLFCDSVNQRLMVGSDNGLGVLDIATGHWQRFGPAEGLNVNNILSIDVVGRAIWIAVGDKGADMIMGNTIFPFNGASGFPSGKVNDLSVAPDASLWLAYSTGLVHYHDKKWYSYGAQTRSGIPFQSVDRVEVGPDKRIWIASAEEGICPFNPVSLACSTVYPSSRSAPITSLTVGPDNVAYAGTDGAGVLILDGDKVRHLVFNRHQLVSNDVMDIVEGSDGKLWIATDRGVNKIDISRTEDAWQVVQTQPNQLAFPAVSGLLPVPNGMWFFYQGEPQASFFDGSRWLHLDSTKGIPGPVLDAAVDQRGYIWFATSEAIEVWDGTAMRTYSPTVIPPGTKVYALLGQDDGMWVGTDKGLLRYQHFQWQVILPDIVVNAIIPDENGNGLLLGTDQGLIRYENGQSFLWIFNLGNEIIKNPKVTSVAWDGNHHLWAGTAGQGLFNFDGTHWQQFNSATGLPTDNVRKIYTDQLGSIWIAAVTGKSGGALVRFTP